MAELLGLMPGHRARMRGEGLTLPGPVNRQGGGNFCLRGLADYGARTKLRQQQPP